MRAAAMIAATAALAACANIPPGATGDLQSPPTDQAQVAHEAPAWLREMGDQAATDTALGLLFCGAAMLGGNDCSDGYWIQFGGKPY